MALSLLKDSWRLYRRNFGLIVAAVTLVWLPMELWSSYLHAYVFDPEDFWQSFRFVQCLEQFFGIIATAAVIAIGHTSLEGGRPTLRAAMAVSLRSWWRMFWASLALTLTLFAGFLLLIVPGIWLLVRLILVQPLVVCERLPVAVAIRQSFALTEGRFWPLFRFLSVGISGWLLVIVGLSFAPLYVPALDHWLSESVASTLIQIATAFLTICALQAYCSLAKRQ